MEFIRKHCNQFYIGISTVAILLAVILAVRYGMQREAEAAMKPKPETVTTIIEKEKKDKVNISVNTKTIREGLANMGFLITQEYFFTQVETYTKEKKILYFLTSSSEFVYSYDGYVTAGVDFEKIKVETDESSKVIRVEMPPSETRNAVFIDKDSFKIYSEKDSFWNPLKLEDYNISLKEFEDAAEAKAIEGGILERADRQAKNLVLGFINSLPDTVGYTVEFK